MQGLSGAHFATCDESGRLIDSTLPGLAALPPGLRALSASVRLEEVGSYPKLEFEGGAIFRGVGPTGRRPDAAGALPRDGLAAGEVGGQPAPARCGRPLAGPDGGRDRFRRPPPGHPPEVGPGASRGDRGGRLPRDGRTWQGRRGRQTRPIGPTDGPETISARWARPSAGPGKASRRARPARRGARPSAPQRCDRRQGWPCSSTPDAARAQARRGSLDVALRQLSLCEEQVKGLLSTDRGIGNHPADSTRPRRRGGGRHARRADLPPRCRASPGGRTLASPSWPISGVRAAAP